MALTIESQIFLVLLLSIATNAVPVPQSDNVTPKSSNRMSTEAIVALVGVGVAIFGIAVTLAWPRRTRWLRKPCCQSNGRYLSCTFCTGLSWPLIPHRIWTWSVCLFCTCNRNVAPTTSKWLVTTHKTTFNGKVCLSVWAACGTRVYDIATL